MTRFEDILVKAISEPIDQDEALFLFKETEDNSKAEELTTGKNYGKYIPMERRVKSALSKIIRSMSGQNMVIPTVLRH